MELAYVCPTDKASDLIVDLKDYFGAQSDRDLIEIALTLTGIVVDNADHGNVIVEGAATGRRTTLALKEQLDNVVEFHSHRRTSPEVVPAHSQDDCA
ncbi:MAG: hypothetical protein ACR2P3_12780 [Geminicoccaceae bacterium]